MSRVRSKDTKPEMVVRRTAHQLGYRFRLHRKDLPGSPDLVLPSRGTVIFVHGCFWHRHPECRKATNSKTRSDFWEAKFARNVERDSRDQDCLRNVGWKVVVIWECETRNPSDLSRRLIDALGPGRAKEG
jgi:DNA mismatch endonuclease (patch repair protein)